MRLCLPKCNRDELWFSNVNGFVIENEKADGNTALTDDRYSHDEGPNIFRGHRAVTSFGFHCGSRQFIAVRSSPPVRSTPHRHRTRTLAYRSAFRGNPSNTATVLFPPCQGWGRGFESRPLQFPSTKSNNCRDGPKCTSICVLVGRHRVVTKRQVRHHSSNRSVDVGGHCTTMQHHGLLPGRKKKSALDGIKARPNSSTGVRCLAPGIASRTMSPLGTGSC